MPIRPENMALYPGGSIKSPEWMAIRAFIRARAGDCCEECGIGNGSIGIRLRDGGFAPAPPGELGGMYRIEIDGIAFHGKVIQIVCTVAHIDHDVTHNHETNLRFWCQRCHNRHDAKQRQENATITRHEKAGQLDLIGRG